MRAGRDGRVKSETYIPLRRYRFRVNPHLSAEDGAADPQEGAVFDSWGRERRGSAPRTCHLWPSARGYRLKLVRIRSCLAFVHISQEEAKPGAGP